MGDLNVIIFPVEHGNCALIITPNGKHVLIDCGHNDTTGFRPSTYLTKLGLDGRTRRLAKLVISNVDQDHISDLPNVYSTLRPEVLARNPNIGRHFLDDVKDEITEAMGIYIKMHETYTGPAEPDWGGVQFTSFYHSPRRFSETNDLSFVSFVQYGSLNMVFPGDLTRSAWLGFLENENFIKELCKTNVFIASHHGREDGYCQEVFGYCKPDLVLISDESIKYDTQKDISYSRHASGRYFDDGVVRKVLTTRNNGTISLWCDAINPPYVHIERA